MPTKKEYITLSGGQARRFREIKEDLEAEFGFEPSNPQVAAELMKEF